MHVHFFLSFISASQITVLYPRGYEITSMAFPRYFYNPKRGTRKAELLENEEQRLLSSLFSSLDNKQIKNKVKLKAS